MVERTRYEQAFRIITYAQIVVFVLSCLSVVGWYVASRLHSSNAGLGWIAAIALVITQVSLQYAAMGLVVRLPKLDDVEKVSDMDFGRSISPFEEFRERLPTLVGALTCFVGSLVFSVLSLLLPLVGPVGTMTKTSYMFEAVLIFLALACGCFGIRFLNVRVEVVRRQGNDSGYYDPSETAMVLSVFTDAGGSQQR